MVQTPIRRVIQYLYTFALIMYTHTDQRQNRNNNKREKSYLNDRQGAPSLSLTHWFRQLSFVLQTDQL